MNATEFRTDDEDKRNNGTVLQGELVALTWPDDHDYTKIERWLTPTSHAATLTGDTSETVTAETVREANTAGRTRFYMIMTNSGESVGVVNHRQVGGVGNYAIGAAIGADELWDKGFGFEGCALVVEHLFQNLNANRVQFQVAMFNKRMVSMLTRSGFILDGVLRDYYFLDGRYHDATIWSILRHEFYASVENGDRSDRYPIMNLIPEQDKEVARKRFQEYLDSNPDTSLSMFSKKRNSTSQ